MATKYVSSGTLVNDILIERLGDTDEPNPALPGEERLRHIVSHHRRQNYPAEPHDLTTFDIVVDALPPNFFRREVVVGEHRHYVFATDRQLQVLARARMW